VRGRYAGESCPALDLESAKRQSRIALARLAYATFPLLMPAVDVRTDVGAGAEGGSLRRWWHHRPVLPDKSNRFV